MQVHMDGAGPGVEAAVRLRVSDLRDHLAGYGVIIHLRPGRDLTEDMDLIGSAGDLAGHMGRPILRQKLIQNTVRDLVADRILDGPLSLIRM